MDFKKAVNDFIDRQTTTSLRLMLGGVLLLAVFIFALTQIRPTAQSKLESMLDGAGFKSAEIGELSLRPTGLHAKNIKLDQYGFDRIDTLSADFNWLSFLASGKISQLTIDGLSLSRTPDTMKSSTRRLAANLLNLPPYRISLSHVTLDYDTGYGAIRITGDALSQPDADGHTLKANIGANQYQLGFNSNWQGSLKKDGQLELAGDILDGRLNVGPLRISRFNGWAGTTITADGYSVQSQMEAGSASFMDVPLQTITMVTDSRTGKDDIIIRSGISGMPDILFAVDLTRSEKEQAMTARLTGKNLGAFLKHIDKVTDGRKTIAPSLRKRGAFELTASFQPEKRFVGGPLPFGLTLQADSKKLLDGNILFYPDTFELRGSLETDAQTASAMGDYFHIPKDNIVQDFIRLDGDLNGLFTNQNEQKKAP